MNYTEQEIQLLVENGIIPKGTPQPQIDFFLKTAEIKKLNPILKQIYLIERRSKDNYGNWVKSYTIQAGLDGMRAISQRNGDIKDVSRGTLIKENAEGNKTLYGFCKIVTKDGGVYYDEAPYNEYVQLTKEGKPTRFWKQFPETMIKKVAEESVRRMASAEDLSGVYGDDEMQQADNPVLTEAATKLLAEHIAGMIGDLEKTKKLPISIDNEAVVTQIEGSDTAGSSTAKVVDKDVKIEEPKEEVKKLTQKEIEMKLKFAQSINELKEIWELLTKQQQDNEKIRGWFSMRKSQIEFENEEANKQAVTNEEVKKPIAPEPEEKRDKDWFIFRINSMDNLPHLQNFYKKYAKEIKSLPLQDFDKVRNEITTKEQQFKAALA